MIAYLIGEVTQCYDEFVVLEVGGIGYEIVVCVDYVLSGEQKIYIYENIKEDTHDLYGFITLNDKQIFKKLITVNGVGPKVAAQMIITFGSNQLVSYIVQADAKALTKISGIGTKIANRVILELKDKLAEFYEPRNNIKNNQDYKEEAIEALIALGYTNKEATKTILAIYNDSDTVEELIKKALELLSLVV